MMTQKRYPGRIITTRRVGALIQGKPLRISIGVPTRDPQGGWYRRDRWHGYESGTVCRDDLRRALVDWHGHCPPDLYTTVQTHDMGYWHDVELTVQFHSGRSRLQAVQYARVLERLLPRWFNQS